MRKNLRNSFLSLVVPLFAPWVVPLALTALVLTQSACTSKLSSCPTEQSECGGQCISTAADPDHCGGCGTVCTGEQVCSQGACAAGCSGSLVSCARSCVDTATDATNCGTCGMRCAAGATCQASRCVAMVAQCKDRLMLQSSGAYDANLKTVQVSGRLTKNGATLPDGSYRGALLFVGKRGGSLIMPTFSSSGEATYSGELFAGTYDVSFVPSGSCRSGDALPCQQVLVGADTQVTTAGALDFDVQTIQVAGKLTKNGAALASDTTDRGTLVFTLQGGGARAMPTLGTTGDAKYAGEVFPGTYDVTYVPSGACRNGGVLPCQQTTLRTNVELSSSGALDFDVKTVQVTGKLSKNGVALPDDIVDRGSLVFAQQNGGARVMPSLGVTGAAAYAGEIFAGSYDIRYQPSGSCRSGGVLPCQQTTLRTKTALMASGALDFDVKTIQVTGKLTKNGAAVPDDTISRGNLTFALLTGTALFMPTLGITGDATYKGELFAGTYDINYQPSGSCRRGGALPCQVASLATKTALMASGALDFDAKTVRVTGKLSKNGDTVPDDTSSRGSLTFTLLSGGALYTLPFDTSGPAVYDNELFAGTYDIAYVPSGSCRAGSALPCQQTMLRTGSALMASGALDFDVKTLQISGMLSKNSAVVPTSTVDRGYLVFALTGGSARAMPSFGVSGPATYQGEIFAGSYDISYQPSGACRSGGALPCESQLVVGCLPSTP